MVGCWAARCRRLTDEGLGLLTDRTPALTRLELWGCKVREALTQEVQAQR